MHFHELVKEFLHGLVYHVCLFTGFTGLFKNKPAQPRYFQKESQTPKYKRFLFGGWSFLFVLVVCVC